MNRTATMLQQHFQLIGSGHVLPSQVMTAEDVDHRIGQPAGWTRRITGVVTRHVCTPQQTLGDIAFEAVRRALDDARLELPQIDLVIDASTSRHQPIPSNAPALLRRFGEPARGIACMDVHHTCLSFVMAMHVANGLLGIGACHRILILSAEACTAAANWNHPESACLLGDGAAAVVLRRGSPRDGFAYRHETLPEHYDACGIRGGSHALPPYDYTPDNDADYRFWMDGKRLLRIAREHLPPFFDQLIAQAQVEKDTVRLVPHQASPAGMLGVQRWLGVKPENFLGAGVAHHGNIGAAGIPLTLDRARRDSTLKTGDRLMLIGTAAGYSQAGMVMTL